MTDTTTTPQANGETMLRYWQRTCPECIEAQERCEMLCDGHEDGDRND